MSKRVHDLDTLERDFNDADEIELSKLVASGSRKSTFIQLVTNIFRRFMGATTFSVATYGALGDVLGTTATNTSGINAAIAACVAGGGGKVLFPAGTYTTNATLTAIISNPAMGLELRGVYGSTIIKPTSAVGVCWNIASSATTGNIFSRFVMKGFRVDGTATGTNAVGIQIGDSAAVPGVAYSCNLAFRDVEVYSFTGTGAKAWWVKDVVGAVFETCYGALSKTNLLIQATAGNLPTTLTFNNCGFRTGTGNGVEIVQGFGITFNDCVIEGNALNGVRSASTGGQNLMRLSFNRCWFEGNYASDATKYQLYADGSTAGTVMIAVRGCFFAAGSRGLYFKSVHNFVIDNTLVNNATNQIVVDTSCDGTFCNWPANNSPFASVVTNNSPLYCGLPADMLQAIAQPAWAALTLNNSWVNFGSPFNNAEYYKDTAGRVWLRGTIKSGTTTAGTTVATLPAGFRPVTRTDIYAITSNTAFCSADIDTGGAVVLETAASATWLSLAGISFRTT